MKSWQPTRPATPGPTIAFSPSCSTAATRSIDEGTEVKPDGETSLRGDLIPGAGELVRELKRRGYPLALVADGPVATFENNLGPYGLYDLFDAYAISERVGASKPDAAMFHTALNQLGISPASMPVCSWSATTWAATSRAPTRWG